MCIKLVYSDAHPTRLIGMHGHCSSGVTQAG